MDARLKHTQWKMRSAATVLCGREAGSEIVFLTFAKRLMMTAAPCEVSVYNGAFATVRPLQIARGILPPMAAKTTSDLSASAGYAIPYCQRERSLSEQGTGDIEYTVVPVRNNHSVSDTRPGGRPIVDSGDARAKRSIGRSRGVTGGKESFG